METVNYWQSEWDFSLAQLHEPRSKRMHDLIRGLHKYFTWLYKFVQIQLHCLNSMISNVRRISKDFVQWKVNFMIICLFLEFLFQFHQSFSVILHRFCSIWNIWQHIHLAVFNCSDKWKWFHTRSLSLAGNRENLQLILLIYPLKYNPRQEINASKKLYYYQSIIMCTKQQITLSRTMILMLQWTDCYFDFPPEDFLRSSLKLRSFSQGDDRLLLCPNQKLKDKIKKPS